MSLPVNIEELLHGHTVEWERIECKQSWNPESIMHTIVAFANDINNWGGGYIFVGVGEKDGRPDLPPIGLNPAVLDKMQKDLLNLSYKIQPYYSPVAQPYVTDNKHILVIWAPGGDNRPYKAPSIPREKAQYKYYIRRGSSSVVANQQEEQLLFDMAKRIPFDDRVNHHASLNDLSFGLIRSFLHEIKSGLAEEAPRLQLADLAMQMKIAAGPKENILPLNAGLLFFSEHPHKFFPGAKADVVIYQETDGTRFTEKTFVGPVHIQLRDILSYIRTNVLQERVIKTYAKAEAERIYNFPLAAVEELVANAFYHRSYELQNPIEINCFPDRIEVLSFPGPLPPVTRANLTQKRVVNRNYRNRRLGDFLKELKLTEGRATGFPTIYNSMEQNGSQPPVFETDDDFNYFLAILPVHPEFLHSILSAEEEEQLIINSKMLEILHFCTVPRKRSEILQAIRLSVQTKNYKKHIEPLIHKGWLAFTEKDSPQSPQQKYYTTTAGKVILKEK